MRMPSFAFLVGALGIAAATLGTHVPNEPPRAPSAKPPRGSEAPLRADTPTAGSQRTPPKAPVIGHVETRNRVVTIVAGPRGPAYTLRSKQGQLLYENLSATDLQAKAPDLHDLVKSGYAGPPGQGRVALDASVRVPAPRAEGRSSDR